MLKEKTFTSLTTKSSTLRQPFHASSNNELTPWPECSMHVARHAPPDLKTHLHPVAQTTLPCQPRDGSVAFTQIQTLHSIPLIRRLSERIRESMSLMNWTAESQSSKSAAVRLKHQMNQLIKSFRSFRSFERLPSRWK